MEKIVLRYNKKGYTQSQLDAAAAAFGRDRRLTDVNCEVYADFEELGVFGKDENGCTAEAVLPLSQLERWLRGTRN